MNIVILSRNPHLYSTNRLVEEAENRGHDVEIIDPLKCDIIIEKEKPDIIFYQAGVDILQEDKLGRLHLNIQDCKDRDEIVLSYARKYRIPIAITMGGGYADRLSTIVNAHANTYRLAKEIYF